MSKINLPEEVLNKMTCQSCKNLLSLYPVNIKKDGSGALCGRCKPVEEDQYLRDESYELIAQFLLFPCIYKENGCSKNLVPNLLEGHEPCCEYRKYGCPTSLYTKCKWEGPKKVLLQHFEEKHPNLIINEQRFEIDFTNSIEEKLIMSVNEEIFIVKKDIDARKEIFICAVEYMKSQEKDDVYNYFLRIECNNRNYFHKFPERVADGEDITKTTAHFLREKLQEPPSMLVKIEVLKSVIEENELATVDNPESVRKNPAIDWLLLSELECPVCYDYMLPPIYQCSTGHSICKNCKPRVSNSCPTCKKPVGNTQNFALEKMTQYITYPCKHHKMGCVFTSKAVEIEAHEECCEYGPYDCPLKIEKNCEWNGPSSTVVSHVETTHSDIILKNDRIEIPFNPDGRYQNSYLIIHNKKVFKYAFAYANRFCQWSMKIMGSMLDSQQFNFEIDIFDMTGGKKRFLISGAVVPYTTTITAKNCIKLAYETISAYAENKLSFVVRINRD